MQSGERQEEKHDSAVVLMRLERERERDPAMSLYTTRACPMSTTGGPRAQDPSRQMVPGRGRM
jgi:hypothetical protein